MDEYQTLDTARWEWDVTPRESRDYKLAFTISQFGSDGHEKEVLNADNIFLNGQGDIYFYLGRVSSGIYVGLLLGLVGLYLLWFGRRRGWFALNRFDKVARGFVENVGNVEVTGEVSHRSKP